MINLHTVTYSHGKLKFVPNFNYGSENDWGSISEHIQSQKPRWAPNVEGFKVTREDLALSSEIYSHNKWPATT